MFKTQYDKHDHVYCESGDRYRMIKAGVLDSKKNIVVKEKGKEDFYAYINSFADSVNIHVLLARFANGDKDALLQRAGAFIDLSAMPTDINGFVELYHNGQAYFDSLQPEIKEKFNNNMIEFISKIGTKEWSEIMKQSPNDIKQEKLEQIKQANAVHTEMAKVQYNSVYGDQSGTEPKPIIEGAN